MGDGEGSGIMTQGLGNPTLTTQGYGYTPRGTVGAVSTQVSEYFNGDVSINKLKEAIASAFSNLRPKVGTEVAIEILVGALDNTILAQPGIHKMVNLEGISPASLAQLAYKGGQND
jgi:hypothetical protein